MINDFKQYFLDNKQPIYENPSPGNIAGGITTLEEKSLGAIQKGGDATVMDVRRYGARIDAAGLSILEAPGNDGVSSTAMAASGATVLLFTTGRGTPLGFPAPTIKIASNSGIARSKPHWIDFDAGVVLESNDFESATDDLLALILDVASGAATCNERNDEREIAIWKRGVTFVMAESAIKTMSAYDPQDCEVGIVHIGPGAFHRAHQATFIDDVLRDHERCWAICGVSLNSQSVRDVLAPQDNLYTLAILDKDTTYRVIGSIKELLYAREQQQRVLDYLAAPATRIVSLTITEKGYCLTPSGDLDESHPGIQHDRQNPEHTGNGDRLCRCRIAPATGSGA